MSSGASISHWLTFSKVFKSMMVDMVEGSNHLIQIIYQNAIFKVKFKIYGIIYWQSWDMQILELIFQTANQKY